MAEKNFSSVGFNVISAQKLGSLHVPGSITRVKRQSVAPSAVGSQNEKDDKKKVKPPIIIWPEWSDQDIAAEKWDTTHKAKEKDKARSPNPHPYEDAEGRIDMPSSLRSRVDYWKRPIDFILDKNPVVVDPKSLVEDVDLLSANEHITHSETIRLIISQITNLWKLHIKMESAGENKKDVKDGKAEKDKEKDKEKEKDGQLEDNYWKPWYHIWPKEKMKGSVYNPGGKYCIKIYWLGLWRKVTVDDWMPFDEDGKLLLPCSPNDHELWPMLLSKALIKVASLDYLGGDSSCEFGDFTVVHALTGWIPEIIPLRYGHTAEIWKLLLQALPHWKLDNTASVVDENKNLSLERNCKTEKEKDRKLIKGDKIQGKDGPDKNDAKAKDKGTAPCTTEQTVKEPEFVLFASYSHPPNTPTRMSVLREMADASEKLRQSGLSHNHPHPVMVTLVRDCPLVAPPPPIEIPRWKLIRQKKKKEPVEPPLVPPEAPKEPQFLEITSPFVNYNVSPIPVSRAKTPVRWLRFKPERSMGEIAEEGDKLDEEKKDESGKNEKENGVTEKKETSDPNLMKEASPTKQVGDSKGELDSGKQKLERKSSAKSVSRETVRSAKGDKQDKNQIKGEKTEKNKSGGKLVAEKTERAKSGSTKRRLSRVEKMTDAKSTPEKESRKISKVEKAKPAPDTSDKETVKGESISECTENQSLEVPADGNRSVGAGLDVESGEGKQDGEKVEERLKNKDGKPSEKKLWIEFEDFCKCFGSLYIFHKANTYNYTKSYTELKNVAVTTHASKKSGLNAASSVTGATPVPGKNTGFSPTPYGSLNNGSNNQDLPPPFLFVDSLQPIEIIVSFTAFTRWLDPPQSVIKEKEKEKDLLSSGNEIKLETINEEKPSPPTPGLLVAEPYSWKSVVNGQPVLRIRTTGTKAAALCLPAGRHVLRFLLQSPNGYHLEMCSQTPFVYGDEDTVMASLTKESCRFMEHALSVIHNIGNLVHSFAQPPAGKGIELDLGLKDQSRQTQERHYKVFMKCLFATLKSNLGEMFDPNMHFAWKALAFQASLGMRHHISPRPYSAAEISRIGSMKRHSTTPKRSSSMPLTERSANKDEHNAAEKIQAVFRGHFQRKMSKAYQPDTEEHQQVSELLSKAWSIIEQNIEDFSIEIFRRMFKKDQALFPLFPFFKDEWSRVAYVDYSGGYPEQPPHSWFVLFREVFFVDEPVLTVPKLYVNNTTCLLRVVDNDSGEELTRIFQRVAPNTLKKNKRGYTFIAEARTLNGILPAGKFRLRIIGSTEPLPYPARDSVNSHFVTKEIRDYYIPNKYNAIFRFTVKVTDDHVVSLQLGTSKPDVYIKLQILDHEKEVISTTGKGHAVIPAFTFFKGRTGDDDEKLSARGSRPTTSNRPRSGRRPHSARKVVSPVPEKKSKKSGKQSINSSRPGSSSKNSRTHLGTDSDKEEEEQDNAVPEIKVHKYIIQGQVLRSSWPLSKTSWDFVNMLKSLDKLEITEAPSTVAPGRDKSSASVTKGKKGKDSKDKEGKDSRSSKAQSGSRPSSQHFDSSKPNWTLRVISDANSEEIEVKKDTERQDEIKAMKLAWEAAEPGRAVKAQQSRQKFLSEHMIKVEKESTEEETGDEDLQHVEGDAPSEIFTATSPVQSELEGELTLVPPPKEPDQVLRPLPPPPYIRSRGGDPVLLDTEEEARRQKRRQEIFRAFREQREEVERLREQDLAERNAAKERQLQVAEELQATLDKARHDLNVPREAYRQKFLEAEKQKEVVHAAEAAKEKERSPSPKGSKGRKSTSASKGRKSPPKGKKK